MLEVLTWLNGKKTAIGAAVVLLSSVVAEMTVILPAFVEPAKYTRWLGVATFVVGVAHKAYKAYYREEPKP